MTLYSGIKAGSIGSRSGLRPSKMAEGGRLFKDEAVGLFLGAGKSVVGVLVASFSMHESRETLSNEACGTPCV